MFLKCGLRFFKIKKAHSNCAKLPPGRSDVFFLGGRLTGSVTKGHRCIPSSSQFTITPPHKHGPFFALPCCAAFLLLGCTLYCCNHYNANQHSAFEDAGAHVATSWVPPPPKKKTQNTHSNSTGCWWAGKTLPASLAATPPAPWPSHAGLGSLWKQQNDMSAVMTMPLNEAGVVKGATRMVQWRRSHATVSSASTVHGSARLRREQRGEFRPSEYSWKQYLADTQRPWNSVKIKLFDLFQ